jgi:uncharacterized protein
VLAVALPLAWRTVILVGVGVAAGIANGVAGGGTFLTFPTMLALNIPALQANVSSSVGVLPSYLGGVRGFRRELAQRRRLVLELLPACGTGAGVGTALLLTEGSATFRSVVPWLIGAATAVFALTPLITRRLAHVRHDHPTRRVALHVGVFVSAVYGGYFGAGLGILLLATMGLTLPDDLATLQGVRNALSILINAVAAVVFIIRGHLATDAVFALLAGTLVGGVLGTHLIRTLRPSTVRALIVVLGVATTIRLAVN